MNTLNRSLLIVLTLLAIWSGSIGIERSFGKGKKVTLERDVICVITPEFWSLYCNPDGSGYLNWAASTTGQDSTSFKAGTLNFKEMKQRLKDLSRKEAKPGAGNRVVIQCKEDPFEDWTFPADAKGANQFLRDVFTAATSEKAAESKRKDFDKSWREMPPAFMPR